MITTSGHDQPALAAPGIAVPPKWTPDDPLEPPEQALLDHAMAGKRLDLVGQGRVDHEAMTQWKSAQTVRAAVLRHLLVESQWPVHSRGVWLRGARISGRFDLESATVRCPLLLDDCYLDSSDPVLLNHATAPRIVLTRCRVAGAFAATRLVVDNELALGGTTFDGVVWLLGANINHQLSLRGAKLTVRDDNGNALVGDGIRVSSDTFLDHGFTAAGAVRLLGADINGQLSCRGAELTGSNNDGNALACDGMRVGGAVSLSEKFTAAGTIRLLGAEISSQLSCRGAKLTGTNRDALVGEGMRVDGDVFLDHGFTAAGAVSVAGARIAGSVSLNGTEFGDPVALEAEGVKVGGRLIWAPRSPVRGLVDLERAAVHRLEDDWSLPDAHWPPSGRLQLAGFTYDGFSGKHQASWQQRLDWIRRSHTTGTISTPAAFAAQPYEQLAQVYRQSGQETEAQQVAIARRNDLRRYGSLSRPRKFGNWLLDQTIKHGYRPMRAVGLLIAVYVAVLLVFWGAQHQDSVIVPAKDTKTLTPPPVRAALLPSLPMLLSGRVRRRCGGADRQPAAGRELASERPRPLGLGLYHHRLGRYRAWLGVHHPCGGGLYRPCPQRLTGQIGEPLERFADCSGCRGHCSFLGDLFLRGPAGLIGNL